MYCLTIIILMFRATASSIRSRDHDALSYESSLVTEHDFAKLTAWVGVIGLPPEEIIIGDNVTLRCTARIDKYPLLYWKLGDRKVSNYDDPGPGYRTYTVFTVYFQILDLIIPNINESKYFTCWGEEPEHKNIIRLHLPVYVHVLPEPPSFGPETSNNTVIKAMLGRSFANISCDARGSPEPRIEWFKLPSSASNNSSSKKNVSNWSAREGNLSTLSVPLSDTNNSGVYQCVITNRRGNAQKQFRVIITSPMQWGYIIMVVSVVATGAVLAVVINKCYKTIQKKRRLRELYEELKRLAETEGADDNLDETIPVNEQVDALPFGFRYEIPQKTFEITNVNVGQGAFGKVTLAYLLLDDGQKLAVAAKSPKDWMDKEQHKALIDEVKMMMDIGPHVNVLSLLAMHTKSMENGILYAFTEYCKFKSLKDYLVTRPTSSSPSKSKEGYKRPLICNRTISELDLLSYSYQVANGMAYLASKNLVHRDLALRNVLLTGRRVVKIADFSLTRPIGQSKIITDEGRMNPKWQPLESIKTGQYAEKSDVWSFGIVLWEIFTFGDTPYREIYEELAEELDVSTSDVSQLPFLNCRFSISQFLVWLEHGNRLEQPAECPNDIFELMTECWHADRVNRPSFSTCQEKIKNAIFIRSADYWKRLENFLDSMTHIWVVPQCYNISPVVWFGMMAGDSKV